MHISVDQMRQLLSGGTEGQVLASRGVDEHPHFTDVVAFGLSSVTAGDILYADDTDSLASLAKSTRPGMVLRNSGASNVPAWGPAEVVLYSLIGPSTDLPGTTAAETALAPASGEGSLTIPVADLLAGAIFRFDGLVVFTSDADGDETLTVNLYLGSQLLGTTGAIAADVASSISFRGQIKIKTVGASGTGVVTGEFVSSVGPTVIPIATAFTAFDTTTTKAFAVKADWGGTTDSADTASLQDLNIYLNNVD